MKAVGIERGPSSYSTDKRREKKRKNHYRTWVSGSGRVQLRSSECPKNRH